MDEIRDLLTLFGLLRNFGLDPLEANVYGTLLTSGPAPLARLIRLVGVEPVVVCRCLEALASRMLVGSDDVKGIVHHYASEPGAAWRAIAADLRWQEIFDVDKPAANVTLPKAVLCLEIAQLAYGLYHPHVTAVHHRERDVDTHDELARRTCEIISMANREVLAASRTPRLPQVASFWTVITDRIAHGVRYRRLTDLQELIDHGLVVVARDIEVTGVDLSVLEAERIDRKFYVVDCRWLSVYHGGGASSVRGVGRVTNQHQIAKRYTRRFADYRRDSIPGAFVVARLREAGEELLEKAVRVLDGEEMGWVKSLIEGGKFTTYARERDWSQERLAATTARALATNVVRLNGDGVAVPAYTIDEKVLRSAFDRSRIVGT